MNLSVGYAQYSPVTTVKTPAGSTVPNCGVFTGTDVSFNANQLLSMADELYIKYNGAQLMGPPSYKYNCHTYALHTLDGEGSNVWIGVGVYLSDVYWVDGSYKEVSESQAQKVSYTGNHTAERLNSTWYQSKWGSLALVKHHPNDVPLDYLPSSTKKYYAKLPVITISGPTSVNVGSPNTYIIYTSSRYMGPTILEYQWVLSPTVGTLYDYGSYATAYFNSSGSPRIEARARNTYGWGPWSFIYISANRQSPAYNVYPNPVRDILYIDIPPQTLSSANRQMRYDIQLYDMQGNLAINTTTTQTGTVQINVQSLKNGSYLLQIYDGGAQPYSQTIIKQ